MPGALAGFSGASVPTNASYDVGEAFAEFRAPLVQDAPGAYDLTADAGYRWSNYSTAGVTNTYKFEVQYAPIKDARMRFSFDRAVRAPNLVELFVIRPRTERKTPSAADPCAPTLQRLHGYVHGAERLAGPVRAFGRDSRTVRRRHQRR